MVSGVCLPEGVPNPARTGEFPTMWALLIVLPALLLVLALLGTVVLLIAG